MPVSTQQAVRDYRRSRLKDFDPRRDVPGAECVLDLDAGNITGVADGARVAFWPDASGFLNHVRQDTNASRPVLEVGGANGRNYVDCRGGEFMRRAEFGVWPGLMPQPTVIAAVARCPVSGGGTNRTMVGGGTNRHDMAIESGQNLSVCATSFTTGGDKWNDNEWHVFVGVMDTDNAAVFVDGRMMHAYATQAHGTNAWSDLGVGARADGSNEFDGDIARVIAFRGRLSLEQVYDLSARLGALYGITINPQIGTHRTDGTAGGTHNGAIRYWMPGDGSSPTKLIIYSHQAGASATGHLVGAGFVTYPLIHAFVQEGWAVVAPLAYSSSSTDNWGSTRGMEHTLDAYNFMVGLAPGIAKVGMVGLSMGGLISSLAAAGVDVTIPNIKGVALIDGVSNLANMHANVTYTSAIRTAYGVAGDGSDYAAKTSGHDPALRSISDFTGVRWRFYIDSGDTTVPPAIHGTAFSTALLAANPPAAEAATVSHTGGHLSVRGAMPTDLVSFFRRSFA